MSPNQHSDFSTPHPESGELPPSALATPTLRKKRQPHRGKLRWMAAIHNTLYQIAACVSVGLNSIDYFI